MAELPRIGPDQPEVPRSDNGLNPRPDPQRFAGLGQVALNGSAGDPEDQADVAGALALLGPIETFDLTSAQGNLSEFRGWTERSVGL